MRASLLLLAACVASGCIHATPMMTPEVLRPGASRVEVGFTSVPYQGSVRARVGLLPGTEAGARLDLSLLGAVVVGGDASVQVLPPVGPHRIGAVATLGVSRSYVADPFGGPNGDHIISDYLYPSVMVGTEGVHGGIRAVLPRERDLAYGVGPFVGRRVATSTGSFPYAVHGELALLYFQNRDGLGGAVVLPFPAVTFSRR